MKIKVLMRHIKKGKPAKPRECPVTLAIKETINQDFTVSVGQDEIHLNGVFHLPQPDSVHQFIRRFDSNTPQTRAKAKSFTFDLPIEIVGNKIKLIKSP